MKKLFLLIWVFSLTQVSFTQNYEKVPAKNLPSETYKGIYSDVDDILSSCCQKFNASYNWGKTTMTYLTEMGNNLKVEGTVSYRGQSCGEITTDYYIVFNSKTGIPSEWCIYTPYCWMGMQTSIEWDCKCVEYYTTEQKMQFVSKNAPLVIQFLNK